MRASAPLVALMITLASPAAAQELDRSWSLLRPRPYSLKPGASSLAAPRSSLLLEALGGSVGSAAGMGAVLLASDCGVDDLACGIISVITAGAAGALGATLGATLVAHRTGGEHSAAGAAVGAILGTGVGLGVHYVLNRNSDRNLGDAIVLPIFAISQGLFAAIGGRW
jgi:hypothetical protein